MKTGDCPTTSGNKEELFDIDGLAKINRVVGSSNQLSEFKTELNS